MITPAGGELPERRGRELLERRGVQLGNYLNADRAIQTNDESDGQGDGDQQSADRPPPSTLVPPRLLDEGLRVIASRGGWIDFLMPARINQCHLVRPFVASEPSLTRYVHFQVLPPFVVLPRRK